jgi:ribosomal protein S18 acetylase RimI-like enzyme
MIRVVAVGPEGRQAALELLFSRLPAPQRAEQVADLVRACRRQRVSLDGLLLAELDGEPAGAALVIVQPDRTAFVWPPGVRDLPASDAVAGALLQAVIGLIDEAGAWIGQCLVDPASLADRALLERNGFMHLTDLRFLVRPLTGAGPEPPGWVPPAGDLQSVVFEPGVNDERFGRLLEQTYEATRDCPELEGLRSGTQALAGHRLSGEFEAARWKLYRWQGRDAAVLLMNDHPEQDVWELVYMGVARASRGHGLGRRIVEDALRSASRAGRSGVVLAVDSRNEYASRIYDAAGFLETERKAVHVYLPRRGSAGAARC